MKDIRWSLQKNEMLKMERGVSFEDVLGGRLIAIQEHPKKDHQQIMVFEFRNYIWIVPFVETSSEIFLKTAYPSRAYTKRYYGEEL